MRSLLLLALMCVAACGERSRAGSDHSARLAPPSTDPTAAEAKALGQELFGIMDKVMAYKSDHFNQLPKTLPALGVDSLTRTTVRRLMTSGGIPTVTVTYRHAEGHAIGGCTGTNKVLEDSMLNGGAFEVSCTMTSGEAKTFTIGG